MDELKEILLDGEKVLWSGKPDWMKAEPIKKGLRAKAGTIKFLAAASLIFMAMMGVGAIFEPSGFVNVMLGTIIIFTAIAIFIALVNAFQSEHSILEHQDHVYAITDQRLIIHDRSRLTTHSLMGAILYEISTVPNGSVKNLNISYAHPDEGFCTLYALIDVTVPEKILLERMAFRKV